MKRKASPIDVVVLLVLCILGIALGKRQSMARADGKAEPVTAVVQTLISPVSRPFGNAAVSSSDFFSGLFAAKRLTAENRRLQALAISAAMYTEQLERLNGEIERLRTLQGFPPLPGKTRVPAEIVGYMPYENRITLSAGANKGIKVGCPVESPEGLVGTVQVVEPDRCQALLLTSTGLTIGALDNSRNPPPAGFLRGENSSTLTLTFQDPVAPVEIGDRIVTSGFSDRIPRGILIGRVISVERDEEFGSLHAKIDPIVSVGNLREVHILK